MDEIERALSGLLLLIVIQILIGGSAVYFLRHRTKIEPGWSWLKSARSFFFLMLIVFPINLIPDYGIVLGFIGLCAGLMRITGLRFLSAFLVLFLFGALIFLISAVLSVILDVDLLTIQPKVY